MLRDVADIIIGQAASKYTKEHQRIMTVPHVLLETTCNPTCRLCTSNESVYARSLLPGGWLLAPAACTAVPQAAVSCGPLLGERRKSPYAAEHELQVAE